MNKKIRTLPIVLALLILNVSAQCDTDCIAACEIEDYSKTCLTHCGCHYNEVEKSFSDVVAHYDSLETSKSQADMALKELAKLSSAPAQVYESQITRTSQNYDKAASVVEQKTKDLQISEQKCGLSLDKCDMTCVRSCAYKSWIPWSKCFASCGCSQSSHVSISQISNQPWKSFDEYSWGQLGKVTEVRGRGMANQRSKGITFQLSGAPYEKKSTQFPSRSCDGTNSKDCDSSNEKSCPYSKECGNCDSSPCEAYCEKECGSSCACYEDECGTDCHCDKPDQKECPECEKCPPKPKPCEKCEKCEKPAACEKCKNCTNTTTNDCSKCQGPSCPPKENCATCEKCVTCTNTTTNDCSKCQGPSCPPKENCTACEKCETCNKTEGCKTCVNTTTNDCSKCPGPSCPAIKDCEICKECEKCKTCNTTQDCKECEKCKDPTVCEQCVKCENKTCPNCETCEKPAPCPNQTICQKENCTACKECPACKICEECKTPEECQKCQECKNTTCPLCPVIQQPVNNCTNTTCPEPVKCQNCTKCPAEKICENCTTCKECETCKNTTCPDCICPTPPKPEPVVCPNCTVCKDCPPLPTPCEICKEYKNTSCPECKECKETPKPEPCVDKVCQNCTTCKECPPLPLPCEICKECKNASCPECKICQELPKPEPCVDKVCPNCTVCKDCPPLPTPCETCKECKNTSCPECKICQEIPKPEPCVDKVCPNCTTCPAEKVCQNCTTCKDTICPSTNSTCNACPKPIQCKNCTTCPTPVECKLCEQCKDCEVCTNCTNESKNCTNVTKECPLIDCDESCPFISDCDKCSRAMEACSQGCPGVFPPDIICPMCPSDIDQSFCCDSYCNSTFTCDGCPKIYQNVTTPCICTEEKCRNVTINSTTPCKCPPCYNSTIYVNQTTEVNCTGVRECPIPEPCPRCNTSENCPNQETCYNITTYWNSTTTMTCNSTAICPTSNCSSKINCSSCPSNCPNKPCPVANCTVCPDAKDCPACNLTCPGVSCNSTTHCPKCPNVTCENCKFEELNYTLLIIERLNIYRIISVAISKYVVNTHYIQWIKNITSFEIIREIIIRGETHITVTTHWQDLTIFVKITKIDGFEYAYQIQYFIGEKLYTLFVIVDRQVDGSYTCIILSTDNLEIYTSYNVVVYKKIETLTGYGFTIKEVKITSIISKIVTIFIERYTNVVSLKRNIISATQQVTYHVHHTRVNGLATARYWQVVSLDFNEVLSVFQVRGVDSLGNVVVTYQVTASQDSEHHNLYKVSVQHLSTSYQYFIIVLRTDEKNAFRYWNVILNENELISPMYKTTIVFRGTYFAVYQEVFTEINYILKEIIITITTVKEKGIVIRESSFAVSAVIMWTQKLKGGEFELTVTKSSETRSFVTAVSLVPAKKKGPWTIDVTQREYKTMAQLYDCQIEYPTGNVYPYITYVQKVESMVYDVSIIVSTTVQVTYRIVLEQVKGTDTFRVISITEISSDTHQNALLGIKEVTGPGKGDTTIDYSHKNTTVTTTVTISNKTTTGVTTKTIEYKVYVHPVTNRTYWVFSNNTVIDTVTKKIVSETGGVSWLLSFFSSSVTTTIEEDYKVYFLNLTKEKWKIYPDGKVYTYVGKYFVTDGGLEGLLKLITGRETSKYTYNATYTIYRISNTDQSYKVYADGTVTTLTDIFVTQGGLASLLTYLSKSLTTYTTTSGYQVAIDTSTGTTYFIYNDGKVTLIDGTFICSGGVNGLSSYLMTTVISTTVTTKYPEYQTVHVSDGRTFYMYTDGKVTLPDGTQVCVGGINGLKTWLTKTVTTTVVTVTTVVRPTYQTFVYNSNTFHLYANGTITKQNGEVITTGGLDGFRLWIVNRSSTSQTQEVTFQTVVDSATGDKYLVYGNGTVTTIKGVVVCFENGMTCLKEYLYSKADSKVISSWVKTTHTTTTTIEWSVYTDKDGNEYWINAQRQVYNPRTQQIMYIFDYDTFYASLLYKKKTTITKTSNYYIVGVEGTEDEYIVFQDGSVYTRNNKFVCNGGMNGLIKYLTVNSLVEIQQINNLVSVEAIALEWEFNPVDNSFFNLPEKKSSFCKSASRDEAFQCLVIFIATHYYKEVLAAYQERQYEIYVDGNGIEYYVYTTGLVTETEGKVICPSDGVECLYRYLTTLYKQTVTTLTITVDKTQTSEVKVRYDVYVDTKGNYFWYFLNGTMIPASGAFDIKNVLTKEQVYNSNMFSKLTYTKGDIILKNLTYSLVKVIGFDEESEQIAKYVILEDGSVWYKLKYFLCWGGQEGLIKYLTVKKAIRTTVRDDWIYVTQINKKFAIKEKPDRLMHENGTEICRNTGFQGIYSCLIEHLSLHYFDSFVYQKETVAYKSYISSKGLEYYIYENGTVTTSSRTFICNGGINCLIEYFLNLESDIQVVGKSKTKISEQRMVYIDPITNVKYAYFNNNTMRNENTKVFDVNLINRIVNGSVKFIEQSEFSYETTVTFVKDVKNNIEYKLLSSGRVLTLNNTMVTHGGIPGLRAWIQVYYNTKGVASLSKGKITFELLNNLQFDLIKETGVGCYGIRDLTGKYIVYPRDDIEELFNLLHYYLIQAKLATVTHSIKAIYQVVQDNTGYKYQVFNQLGLVVTVGSYKDLVCSGQATSCLQQYLANKNLVINKATTYTVYETSNALYYAIYPDGEVFTYPSLDTKICTTNQNGETCLLNHLKGIKQDAFDVDYELISYGGVTYYLYKTGRVTFVNGTEMCKSDGLKCIQSKLTKLTVTTVTGQSYSIYKNANNNETYRVYLSGTVTFENGTYICSGGQDGLVNWIINRMVFITYSIVTLDDGRTFRVDSQGVVRRDPDQFIVCKEGGVPCLKAWLEDNTPHQVSVNGELFNVFDNGTVFFFNGKVLCQSGGNTCIRQYIEDQKYTTYQFGDGLTFKIFGNGTVMNATSNVIILTTGGEHAMYRWIEDQKPKYTQYEFGSRVFQVYQNGTVYEEATKTIITITGGVEYLVDYLSPKYTTFQYNEFTFYVYHNGKVTYANGDVVCLEGGRECLEKHISDITPQITTYTVNAVKYVFNIYNSGKVTDNTGKVICTEGGIKCVEQYLTDLTPQIYEYQLGSTLYVFRIYTSGKVLDQNDKVICAKDGVVCLQKWISDQTPSSIEFDGKIYLVYTSGKVVIESTGVVISETGGQDYLEQWLSEQMPSQFSVPIGDVTYIFNVYTSGKVEIDSTKEVICSVGGEICLKDWISERTPAEITHNNIKYFIFASGKVTMGDTKTVICTEGGQTCLQDYIRKNTASKTTATINNKLYTFSIYQDGRVFDQDNNQICQVGGGVECLQIWVNDQTPSELTYGSETYYIYNSGLVKNSQGVQVCATGGQKCVENWIKANTASTIEYTIGDQTMYFGLYQNGTVINKVSEEVICTEGGQECLQTWISENTPQELSLKYNDKVFTFKLYQVSGKVLDSEDNVVCETGGQECLQIWIKENGSLLGAYSQVNYEINGVSHIFNVFSNGTVVDFKTSKVVCNTAGCLEKYVQDNLKPNYILSTITINGKATTYKIFADTGKVVDVKTGAVICATGGEQCLKEKTIVLPKAFFSNSIDGSVSISGWTFIIMLVVLVSLTASFLFRRYQLAKNLKAEKQEITQNLTEALLTRSKVQASSQ